MDFFKTIVTDSRFVPFYLSSEFVEGYAKKEVPWGPVGELTALRTYSRWITTPQGKRKELWHEIIRRVVEGAFTIQKRHCFLHKVPWNNAKAQNSAKIMYDLMFNMKFLPPGRGLWMMGTEYVDKRGSACLNNCAFVSTKNIATDPITPFRFLMDMSMLGVGVGFDTKGTGQIVIRKPAIVHTIAQIPDTREGWVEAMAIVLSGFLCGTDIPEFDYSAIRPEGTPIKGFGGEASGPAPLAELLLGIQDLMNPMIDTLINSTTIVDLCDMIGRCVVSGNVRRSALIALGDPGDTEFIEMKNKTLHPKECESHRWASNNSVKCEVGQNYEEIAKRISSNGEPGIVWMDAARRFGRLIDLENGLDYKAEGVNPCGEQTLESFELCCLVETFPSLHSSYEEYQKTLKYAYLYAKTITLIPTHWEQTNAVMLRNRRIGTSQSGITNAFAKHGRKNMLTWCDHGYKYLKTLDTIYSDWLCVPRSIKITSVKPSGSVSLLPGVSAGIHYDHSEYYIRRITVAKTSALVKIFKDAGYVVENSFTDKTASLICIPVHVKDFIKGKTEVTMWEQLLNAADYQKFWADNQVSITVTFNKEEARDIETALSIFDSKLKGISMLPLKEHGYPQAPYEEITKEQYEKMTSCLSKPDYRSFIEESIGEKFCDGDSCKIN